MAQLKPQSSELAPRLLPWFDCVQRDLPWRRTRNPYRIWVSEVMLQQTQVDRVIPYYRRFLRAFPSCRALAESSLAEVLRLWSGLGYYSRARNLHGAAHIIVREYGGRFPRTLAEARALPGVGEYTAGAVLSIAYGARLPAVDANAARVLRRVFHNNRRPPLTPAALRRLGLEALPEQRPGDFNQALMELGALICAPSRPNCKECPLTDRCRWSPAGTGPVHRRTSIKPITKVAAVVLTRRGRVLIAQRPPVGLWAGLWEFPWQEVPADEESLETSLRLLINDLGLQTGKWEALTTLRYGVMSRRYHLNAFSAQVCAGRARSPRHAALRWVPPDQLPGYAFPSPHARLVAKLLQG